jgi:hypothetical protein
MYGWLIRKKGGIKLGPCFGSDGVLKDLMVSQWGDVKKGEDASLTIVSTICGQRAPGEESETHADGILLFIYVKYVSDGRGAFGNINSDVEY